MQFPKISIVTTSFNQGHYLEETIQSVLNQQYPNLEYIIIDGGSTDNSVEIIKKYEKHLAYWVSEKDNGMYDGVQKGFEKSTGEIMAWINSDDWYHQKSFFVVAEIFSKFKNVEWLQGLPSIIDETGRIVSINNFRRWTKYDFLRGDFEFIQQESCFWRRELWQRSGASLNTQLKYAGDFALWLTFFDFTQLHCTNTIIGGFRARSSNQFSVDKMTEYRAEANQLLKMRQNKASAEEKRNLVRLRFYKNFLSKIPFVSALYYHKYIEPLHPRVIYFERMQQGFVMSKEPYKGYFDILRAYVKSKLNKTSAMLLAWLSLYIFKFFF